ncbi:hypothetical protein [Kitasatospora sp. MBT66]|uniref:hypothetical protein n=1 Tax=Kitasatospora sp. MBT66 TaxID=1444769 RepID=UPI0005BA3CC5|nr:hypothetical protein [Kitasatospora sp. MBT66]
MPSPTGYTLAYPQTSDRPQMAVRFTVAPDAKGTWTVKRQPYGAAGRMLTGDQPRRYFGDEARVRAEAAYRGLVVRECLHVGQLIGLELDPRDVRFQDGWPTLDGMDAAQWLEALGTD